MNKWQRKPNRKQKPKTQRGRKTAAPTNVFSRAFRIGKTREELKQQLHNFCVRFIELKHIHYPSISKQAAKLYIAKWLKLDENLNPTGLTIEQLEYRVRKARNMLLALRRRTNQLNIKE